MNIITGMMEVQKVSILECLLDMFIIWVFETCVIIIQVSLFLFVFSKNVSTVFHKIFRDNVYLASFCDAIFSKTTQDIFFKVSLMIDKGLKLLPDETQVSRLKAPKW